MPRTGITEPQIQAAIQALQSRGEAITKITVRKELGDTGSFGTISAFLQRWRQDQAPSSPEPAQPVPETVQGLFARAWAAAQGQARAELALEREAMAQEVEEMKEGMAQLQAEQDEALRVLEGQLEHQASQLAEAAAKEEASQARIAGLAESVGYLKATLEAAKGVEATVRLQLQEREAQVREAEGRLQDFQSRLEAVEKAP